MDSPETVDLSIVLPAFNEGQAVVKAVERYASCMPQWGVTSEVVVIDDGSRDDTLRLAMDAARRFPGVRVLSNPINRGQVASILRGFAESRGRVVMHNGVDLPFAPEETPRILGCLDHGGDVVVVQRADRQAYGLFRKLTSWVNIGLIKLFFHSPFTDHNFVQAYRRRVLDAVEVESRGVSTVTTELILKAYRAGFAVRAIEAEYGRRMTGKSTVTIRKIVRTVVELVRLYPIMRRWRPRAAPAGTGVQTRDEACVGRRAA